MINGTKLLNVCGMSRGKRDGILKNEKERIVVKVGAMHLKGVWISFARGKQLAEQNGIADALYPLFETNIQSFLYHPDNYPRTAAVMAAAQERHAQRQRAPGLPSPGGSGNPSSQPPPLMRANTTPAGTDTSGMNGSLSSSTGWSHDQGHASAPHTAQPSPASLHPNGQASHMHMSLSNQGTSSPTLSQHQGQYSMTQAQQLANRNGNGDARRGSVPLTNVHGTSDQVDGGYGAASFANATGARKVSGLKRSWDEGDNAHGSANASPTERDMQRTGSGGSMAAYKLDDELQSPNMNGRMTKKSKSQQGQRGPAVHGMHGGMGMPLGVSSTGNGDVGQHAD